MLVGLSGFSQTLSYRNYSTGDGLPSNQVYDILQDKAGYIWLATDGGVSRYDGNAFTNYGMKDGLPDPVVFNIHEDASGKIWFTSRLGKLAYFENNRIVPYKHDALYFKGNRRMVQRSLLVLKDQSVILGSIGDGAYRISPGGKVSHISGPDSSQYPYYVFESTNEGMYSYLNSPRPGSPPAPHHNLVFRHQGNLIAHVSGLKSHNDNFFFCRRKNGHIVFAASRFIGEVYSNRLSDSMFINRAVISLYEDSDSCLWIGYLNGGIEKYPPNAGIRSRDRKHYFPQDQVTKVMEDHEHGFWFTTLYSGLFYVPYKDIENLSGQEVKEEKYLSIASDAQHIYVGTNNSRILVYRGRKFVKAYTLPSNRWGRSVQNLYYDNKEGILYITYSGGIFLLKDQKLTKHQRLYGGTAFLRLDSHLFVGSFRFVFKVEGENKNSRVFSPHSAIRPICFFSDERKRIWVGTNEGLYYMRDDSLIYQKQLANEKIYEIHKKGNVFYFCTDKKGILTWDEKTGRVSSLNPGLKRTTVFSMTRHNDSLFWVATSEGLHQINSLRNNIPFTLNSVKGLAGNNIENIIIHQDTLYALTRDGVSFFSITKQFINTEGPRVYINDMITDTISYMGQENPVLEYMHNSLTFHVSALSFKQIGKLTYKYRLKGYSDAWRTTTSNVIQLMFVPHGDYMFEIVAVNEDGVESAVPARMFFTIRQPFWKSVWFILSIFGFIIISGIVILYLRLQRIRRENQIKEQLAGFKQQALVMQMNPHFIFNSLSSIQSYVLSESPLKAAKYLAMFSKLMRKSLQHSRQERITLSEELELLKLYTDLEAMRDSHRINFSFRFGSIDPDTILIPPMLVQPHVENSIKHGIRLLHNAEKAKVEVTFEFREANLYCCIMDNGVGIQYAMNEKKHRHEIHLSAGTDVVKTRLELLCRNAGSPFFFKISDRSEISGCNGTLVEFFIPYSYEDKSAHR